jgi:hypothetical protein
MFHNEYGLTERMLRPAWIPSLALVDGHGDQVHADWADNMLVVRIVNGEAVNFDRSRRRAGMDETTFAAGSPTEGGLVTVRRVPDTVTLILPDGETTTFGLSPGLAKSWYVRIAPHCAAADLLAEVRALLGKREQARWDAFVGKRRGGPPAQAKGR